MYLSKLLSYIPPLFTAHKGKPVKVQMEQVNFGFSVKTKVHCDVKQKRFQKNKGRRTGQKLLVTTFTLTSH